MHPTLLSRTTFAILAACRGLQAELKFEPETIDDKVEIGYGLAIGDVDGVGKKDMSRDLLEPPPVIAVEFDSTPPWLDRDPTCPTK